MGPFWSLSYRAIEQKNTIRAVEGTAIVNTIRPLKLGSMSLKITGVVIGMHRSRMRNSVSAGQLDTEDTVHCEYSEYSKESYDSWKPV